MSEVTIYGLVCPIEGIVMYVGKSKHAYIRSEQHISSAKNDKTLKGKWLRKILSENMLPIVQIIETCDDSKGKERETFWINHYRSINPSLTNSYLNREPSKPKPHGIRFAVREVAESKGFTISKLQRKTGLTMGLIRRYWFNDCGEVKLSAPDQICDLLKCEPCDLIVMNDKST